MKAGLIMAAISAVMIVYGLLGKVDRPTRTDNPRAEKWLQDFGADSGLFLVLGAVGVVAGVVMFVVGIIGEIVA